MSQGNYIENTQDLIRRSQQTMGETPVLDLTNWQSPRYMSRNTNQINQINQIRSLSGSCHMVEIRNTVDGTRSRCPILVDSSIVMCTSPTIGDCPTGTADPCPLDGLVDTTQYMNMLAVFTMGDAQSSVDVIFKYVLNGTPTTTTITTNVAAGLNHVYAFATNQLYPVGTTLVLYGAEVLT